MSADPLRFYVTMRTGRVRNFFIGNSEVHAKYYKYNSVPQSRLSSRIIKSSKMDTAVLTSCADKLGFIPLSIIVIVSLLGTFSFRSSSNRFRKVRG